jgi:L-ascorbate metabolism protein UlaG (beta-lactamase superfamily)
MQATWLGHASVLAQWDGWNVLTDPLFSKRASPTQLFGPKRARPPPVKVKKNLCFYINTILLYASLVICSIAIVVWCIHYA